MHVTSCTVRTLLLALVVMGAVLLLRSAALAAPGQVTTGPGLYVFDDDGHRPDGFKDAYEFTVVTTYQQTTFVANLTNGSVHRGRTDQLMLVVNYQERDTGLLIDKMEKAIKLSEAAAVILKPRLQQLKDVSTRPAASLPASGTKPQGLTVVLEQATYADLKPSGLSNGMLRFLHAGGGLSVLAKDAPLKGLRLCERLNSTLSANADFKQLLATFVPVLVIDDATYHGVKIESEAETELRLRTDEGRVMVHRARLFKSDVELLTSAAEREAAWNNENALKQPAGAAAGPKILAGAAVETLFKALEAATGSR